MMDLLLFSHKKNKKPSAMSQRAQKATPKIANVINAFEALTDDNDAIEEFESNFPELATPPSATNCTVNWSKIVTAPAQTLLWGDEFEMDDWGDC